MTAYKFVCKIFYILSIMGAIYLALKFISVLIIEGDDRWIIIWMMFVPVTLAVIFREMGK